MTLPFLDREPESKRLRRLIRRQEGSLPEEFDRIGERSRFVEAVRRGLADSDAGWLIDDGQLDLDLDAEFGRLT